MAVGGPGQQVGLVEPAGAGGDDVGHRDLAGVPVGAADGRGAADAGVTQQRLLDDPGVDVVAAADDQVLGPAGEVDEAVGVDAAEVAGVQPAVPDDAVPAHPGAAEAGVGDVPGEHGGPADHQHAGLAGGAVGPGPVVADPDGFDLLPGQGAADRPGPFLARPGPGAGAGRLGEPVALQQAPPGVPGEVLAHRGRQRGRAHDRQPQRADVGVDRDLRQGAVDGGDGGHRRDLVVLDDRPEPGVQGLVAVARRARPHHPGAAEHRGDAGDDQRVDVEQRQPAQHPLPGRQPAAHGDPLGRRRAGWRGCARRSSGRRWSPRCARTRRGRLPPAGPRRPGGRPAARRSRRPGRPRPARGRSGYRRQARHRSPGRAGRRARRRAAARGRRSSPPGGPPRAAAATAAGPARARPRPGPAIRSGGSARRSARRRAPG